MRKKRAIAELPDGLHIHYETMGEGDPVILIHQSIWSNWEYHKLLPRLASRYKVYSPDTLGFGCSDPIPMHWKLEDIAHSFVDMMDSLGIQKASFVGMHIGSKFAIDIAAKNPDRVDKLALGGLALMEDAVRKDWRAKTVMLGPEKGYNVSPKPGEMMGTVVKLPLGFDGSHLLEIWESQKRENPGAKLEYLQRATLANLIYLAKGGACAAPILAAYDMEPVLPEVKCPTLLISGSKDAIRHPGYHHPTHPGSMIAGPVKYKVIWGAGIMGFVEFVDEYAQTILEYFEDPDKYVGTTGEELERDKRQYLFLVEDDLDKFRD